ncbi:TPA: GNAT family N-acetyltransferase [Legionella pneumophila]|nr:GNAT family protein [Legionella pneumophila]HAT3977608.1 GNAT family N-acetyltransferase [Legionella pneumophila]HAT8357973.1 GNAT family N-acetyltransferase [Legionella pneumophila]HAU1208373.1 GNAT family N-acetyltransferase [Legionella pneumophila]HAU1284965.1 GNAT family N-acetyltransferase [Legionella pneumophila]HAU1960765.1 GNAT family N-acetyltransferase [Legionella pneumophila]
MHIEKRNLQSVDKNLIIQLLNDPLVKRHMPLSVDNFDEKHYTNFIQAKESIWENFGFGPWAYFIDDKFVGWGGIQPDGDDFELALVLSPKYWGYGRHLYNNLIEEAFSQLHLNSITILFPPSRTRIKWIFKIGFIEEGRVVINGKIFTRFRLNNPSIKR